MRLNPSNARVVVMAVAFALGGIACAVTAATTSPLATAGSRSGAATGYTLSAPHYTRDAATPTRIDSMRFTISPAVPSVSRRTVVVSVALSTGGSEAYTCTSDGVGSIVNCATTSPQLDKAVLRGVTVIAIR